MNDEKIIELICTGKTDPAINGLYKHFPMMRKMICSNGGSRDDAEDIFHEALIVLVRKVRSKDFKLTALLSTYLFSVCRFLWNDELKKRKNQVFYPLEKEWADSAEKEMAQASAVMPG